MLHPCSTIRSLAAVAAVIREGSFERAAAALGVTPSAVSQRVRGLEERLGTVLVVRGQPCLATDVGRTLAAHVDRVRMLEADLAPSLAPNGPPLTLRVAVNADSLATWFPAAAGAFARSTGLLLDLTLEDEAHTVARLRSGEVLAAVTADPEPVPGCLTIALGSLRYAACASPDYLRRFFPAGVTPEALAVAPHLRFDRRDVLQSRWAERRTAWSSPRRCTGCRRRRASSTWRSPGSAGACSRQRSRGRASPPAGWWSSRPPGRSTCGCTGRRRGCTRRRSAP